jgi:hypothetical protein
MARQASSNSSQASEHLTPCAADVLRPQHLTLLLLLLLQYLLRVRHQHIPSWLQQ